MKKGNIDLMIIGAPKSGTTSLNNYLGQHPNLYTHFTTEFTMLANEEEFEKGLDEHLSLSVYKDILNNPAKSFFIAKRVDVMYETQLMQAVKKMNPDCKIVITLRNPIDRAFSAFKYCRTNGTEPYKKFEDAVFIDDKSRFKGNKKLERNCAYVFRSSYLQHIKNVYSIFPADNVRVYLFEQMVKNLNGPLNEMVSLLKMPPFEFDTSKPFNEGSFSKSDLIAKAIIAPGNFKLFKKLFSIEQRMKMKMYIKKLNASNGKPEERKMQPATRQYLLNTLKNDVIGLDEFLDLPFKKYWPEFLHYDRRIFFNLKYKIANHVAGFPDLYTAISKNLTGRDCYTTKQTDIVIDGHPRSANTYAMFAFQTAQSNNLNIANHIHKKSQFLIAEKYGIPAILLIRDPLDCISSLLIRQPKYNPAVLFQGYYSLYDGLKNSNGFVLGEFNDVTNNYGEIIRQVNAKFGKNFELYYNTKENEEVVKNIIQQQDELKYAAEYDQSVAYPNEKRMEITGDIKNSLLSQKYKKECIKCQKIYAHFLNKNEL